MRTLLLVLLLTLTATAAPAPIAKPRNVTHGDWILVFAGNSYTMVLGADGSYLATNGSTRWAGSWAFNTESRMLLIHEKCEVSSDHWLQFIIRLDPWSLSGRVVTSGGGAGVLVEIRSK